MNTAGRWRHAAFVAYARADDEAHGGWVRDFAAELERALKAQLRGVDLPPLHLGEMGDGAGRAGRLRASCMYLACVGGGLAASADALLEDLRQFEDAMAGQTWRRVYLLGMTEPATKALLMQASFSLSLRLRRDFFDPQHPGLPTPVYLGPGRLLAPAFMQPLGRLAHEMAVPLRAHLTTPGPLPPATRAASGPVFISHASADLEWARAVATYLEAAGLRCWLAARDIAPGSPSYPAEIAKALRASRALVIVVSKDASASPHVAREVTLADECGLPLMPLRVDAEPLGDALAYSLAGAQMVLTHVGPRDAALAALLAALRLRLEH